MTHSAKHLQQSGSGDHQVTSGIKLLYKDFLSELCFPLLPHVCYPTSWVKVPTRSDGDGRKATAHVTESDLSMAIFANSAAVECFVQLFCRKGFEPGTPQKRPSGPCLTVYLVLATKGLCMNHPPRIPTKKSLFLVLDLRSHWQEPNSWLSA